MLIANLAQRKREKKVRPEKETVLLLDGIIEVDNSVLTGRVSTGKTLEPIIENCRARLGADSPRLKFVP